MLGYDDGFVLPIFSVWLQLSPLLTVASRDLRLFKVEVIDAMRAEETISIMQMLNNLYIIKMAKG